MADRISRGDTLWEGINDPYRDCVALEWIRNEHKFGWNDKSCAPVMVFGNHASAIDEQDFVDERVQQMLESKAVVKVYKKPKVVNPLGIVTKSNGKLRVSSKTCTRTRYTRDTRIVTVPLPIT